MRKIAAKASTEDLWRWFLSGSNFQLRSPEIFAELADRLGWALWDQALAVEDPRKRGRAAEEALEALVKRDPWRAFELWRDHRKELSGEEGTRWGIQAMKDALERMGQASAEQMIEMMRALKIFGSLYPVRPEGYRADFDFAAVVAFLDQPDGSDFMPNDLLQEWGRRSPVAFSQWLLEHAQLSTDDEWRWQWQADRALREIAGQSRETPGRAEALEILSRLPAEYLAETWHDSSWEVYSTFSPERLEAAAQMNQRESYLWGAFSLTTKTDEIDPSWAQLPVEDRQLLLERMEQERQRKGKAPTPVQQAAWDRWLKRVKAVWGME